MVDEDKGKEIMNSKIMTNFEAFTFFQGGIFLKKSTISKNVYFILFNFFFIFCRFPFLSLAHHQHDSIATHVKISW